MAQLQSSYIITDYDTSTSKYWALITWAGKNQTDFTDVYYVVNNNQLVPVQLFYPGYYRSLLVRLYNFDGKAVTTEAPTVITYDDKVNQDGSQYKQITGVQNFSSYQQAVDYIASQKSGKHEIIGSNPFVSPVALDAVPDFKLIHSSDSGVQVTQNSTIPEVKIFQYTGAS